MFLASLSAVSLLTITSRHHQHRSHNSATFHHASAVDRQLPAPSQHDIPGKHGTRVTVRNLFGNLPVRVKQRSKVAEQKVESGRLWEAAKASVTGLLLSWGGSVSLRARDPNNRLVFSFGASDPAQTAPISTHVSKPRSAHLMSLLSILNQGNYISVEERSLWVPVSASTSTLSINGAISLLPAPSKSVQFISLGLHPLAAENHNELYDEVNRLFRLSSFGTVEDNADIDHAEKVRRQSDKRHKTDDYTNQSRKMRKGVDRYPMYHLRISLRSSSYAGMSEERFIDHETNIQTIVEILGAIVTQWLSAHQFRSVHTRQKRVRIGSSASPSIVADENKRPRTSAAVDAASLSSSTSLKRGTADVSVRKSKSAGVAALRGASEGLQPRAFAKWSRIKSAKADFFTNHSELPKNGLRSLPTHLHQHGGIIDTTSSQRRPLGRAICNMQPLDNAILNTSPSEADQFEEEVELGATNNTTHDDTITWTDPSTKKTYTLNARTGCVMPLTRPAPNLDSSSGSSFLSHVRCNASVRLPARITAAGKTPWLDGVFKTWDNPIFNASEQQIEKIFVQEDRPDQGLRQHIHHRCSHTLKDNDTTFPVLCSNRLSKEDLVSAEVIAQVDKKFILVKVKPYHDTTSSKDTTKALLVLIDQHAADERIHVEALFQELCAPAPPSSSHYRSKFGHSSQVSFTLLSKPTQFTVSESEQRHFTTHAARFAAWGILFDVPEPRTISARSGADPETQRLLSVTALPLAISERCKADPGLLITFLRSTVWKYASDTHLPAHVATDADDQRNWVRRLASCPEGLVEMVNSRACRSAIMFNDELDLESCKELVRRLATCVFPFICAHGRPSMVPLVDVAGHGASLAGEDARPDGFVRKWKEWKG
jgi:DNA mismatch repair protein MLH3